MIKTYMLDSKDVFMLTYVNWTAICLFNSKTTLAQHRALAELVCHDGGGNSVGLVLLPTHSYKKGVLHKSTAEAQQQIASHGLNLDRQVCLYFDPTSGGGYNRPMMLLGNLVVTADDGKHTRTLKNLLKHPVLNLGEQPRSKDMVWMEDPHVDALPTTIVEEGYVGIQEKHFQIGHVACGGQRRACGGHIAAHLLTPTHLLTPYAPADPYAAPDPYAPPDPDAPR